MLENEPIDEIKDSPAEEVLIPDPIPVRGRPFPPKGDLPLNKQITFRCNQADYDLFMENYNRALKKGRCHDIRSYVLATSKYARKVSLGKY
jgi:hypothetical protein